MQSNLTILQTHGKTIKDAHREYGILTFVFSDGTCFKPELDNKEDEEVETSLLEEHLTLEQTPGKTVLEGSVGYGVLTFTFSDSTMYVGPVVGNDAQENSQEDCEETEDYKPENPETIENEDK